MTEKQRALEIIGQARPNLEALSDAIWDHPEVGYHESFAADAQDFYETFYGFTPDAEALAQ